VYGIPNDGRSNQLPMSISSFGPLYTSVHNRYVVESLKAKGAVFVEELDEIPDTNRDNLARYLTVTKLKLENAIAIIRATREAAP